MVETTSIEALYEQAELEYSTRNPKSFSIYKSATESLPGGNTRTVLFYNPYPLSVVRAHGCRLADADGHEYVDLLGEYTAGLYGHSDPIIKKAITDALSNGWSYGSQHEGEGRLARLIKERFRSIDLIRFTNSGTESALMALAVAKVYTQRRKIMVLSGAYHGGAFTFKSGTSNPINAPHEYIIATYNDVSTVNELIAQHGSDLAAIIVEPMIGSGGCIPATKAFLIHLRSVATETGAVLIFDEVMTSRLFSGGGVQSEMGIEPDMTTLGKYIGGGMSFGAFGGKKAIMSLLDPRTGTLPHAGTFNNNVFTMAVGSVGLELLFTPERARQLHATGENLRAQLNEIAKGTLMKVSGCGSIMAFHFTKTAVEQILSENSLKGDSIELLDLLHLDLLGRGFYIARRGFIALGLPLTEVELDGFVEAIKCFLQKYSGVLSE